jgi:DNA-binding response OmpR family regulator
MARILLVEDDENLRYGLRFNLVRDGYEVIEASTAEDAKVLIESTSIDLGIFDVMLPGMSGLELLEHARKIHRPFPIMMLTARSDESDAVTALRLGADDYVRKPFGVAELTARIDVLLRRSDKEAPPLGPVTIGPWLIDLTTRLATRDLEQVLLTSTEVDLLSALLEQDAAIPREHLLSRVWGVGSKTPTRTLDNHVARLRKKLEERADQPQLLITVHGLGYRLVR